MLQTADRPASSVGQQGPSIKQEPPEAQQAGTLPLSVGSAGPAVKQEATEALHAPQRRRRQPQPLYETGDRPLHWYVEHSILLSVISGPFPAMCAGEHSACWHFGSRPCCKAVQHSVGGATLSHRLICLSESLLSLLDAYTHGSLVLSHVTVW